MDRILRASKVIDLLGISKSTFYEWQNPKSKYYIATFPKKIQIGSNSVGYLESDINNYILSLLERHNQKENKNEYLWFKIKESHR